MTLTYTTDVKLQVSLTIVQETVSLFEFLGGGGAAGATTASTVLVVAAAVVATTVVVVVVAVVISDFRH